MYKFNLRWPNFPFPKNERCLGFNAYRDFLYYIWLAYTTTTDNKQLKLLPVMASGPSGSVMTFQELFVNSMSTYIRYVQHTSIPLTFTVIYKIDWYMHNCEEVQMLRANQIQPGILLGNSRDAKFGCFSTSEHKIWPQKTSVSLSLSASSPCTYSCFLLSHSICCKCSFMGVNYTYFIMIQLVYIPPWDLSALAFRGFNLEWNIQQREHNTLWKTVPTRRVVNTRNLGQRYHRTDRSKQPSDKPYGTPRKPHETAHTTGHNK